MRRKSARPGIRNRERKVVSVRSWGGSEVWSRWCRRRAF